MTTRLLPSSIVDQLIQLDPVFAPIAEQHGPAPDWQRPSGFPALLHIILEQQVSLESAQAAYDKLQNHLPEINPEAILGMSEEDLRACYFSRQKSRYARTLAQAIVSGDLDLAGLAHLEEPEVRAQLCAITGIGNWTADIYLIFCLQHPDIFPIGDIAAVNSLKELTGLKSREAVLERSLQWQPLRSAATKMLWHSYLKRRGRS